MRAYVRACVHVFEFGCALSFCTCGRPDSLRSQSSLPLCLRQGFSLVCCNAHQASWPSCFLRSPCLCLLSLHRSPELLDRLHMGSGDSSPGPHTYTTLHPLSHPLSSNQLYIWDKVSQRPGIANSWIARLPSKSRHLPVFVFLMITNLCYHVLWSWTWFLRLQDKYFTDKTICPDPQARSSRKIVYCNVCGGGIILNIYCSFGNTERKLIGKSSKVCHKRIYYNVGYLMLANEKTRYNEEGYSRKKLQLKSTVWQKD